MFGIIKHYIKSAVRQAKADPLYTWIYIGGVTLSIAAAFTMGIVINIQISPIYPEVNRSETYFVPRFIGHNSTLGYPKYANVSYTFVKKLREIDGVKCASASASAGIGEYATKNAEGNNDFMLKWRQVDDGFFTINEFKFIDGSPITKEDIEGGVRDLVITDEVASKMFGDNSNAVGKTLAIGDKKFRVKGVVEGTSNLMSNSYSQVYYPVKLQETETTGDVEQRLHGAYTATILADEDNIEKVKDGIINMLRKESDGSDWTFELEENLPASYLTQMLGGSSEPGIWGLLKDKMIILVVLLFVPAINLGGLISGRMDARTGELGVRKAFGSNKRNVIWMIISENLVYTIAGGIAGFVISIILIWGWLRPVYNMLTTMVGNFQIPAGASFSFRPEMFVSFRLFVALIGVCLILNTLSALVPAWMSMRHSIVNSINNTRS